MVGISSHNRRSVPVGVLAAVVVVLWGVAARAGDRPVLPMLRSSDVFLLTGVSGTGQGVANPFEFLGQTVFDELHFASGDIVAFEENRLFVYALGQASKAFGPVEGAPPAKPAPQFVRRLFLLRPSTLVVDDLVRVPAALGPPRWWLYCPGELDIQGPRTACGVDAQRLVCRTLLPEKATLKSMAGPDGASFKLDVTPRDAVTETRFLHVLAARGDGQSPKFEARLTGNGAILKLTVTTPQHSFELELPPTAGEAGRIAVSKPGGEALLKRRLLPSGVLPHGAEGMRLLERWDSAYRDGRRPGWDTRRPSSELTKAVEDGELRRCRVVELGCGTGTNAIYLAGKGFEVTAVDIAPTALGLARAKAEKAEVKVRWVLADVLAPPKLRAFDLVYDRGCYHGVRRGNAAGYVATLRRLTRPGSRVLILAGNANEKRHYGPPRVKEEEIRGDFAELFDFQWLRETHFDTFDSQQKGALAWSILLRRKGKP